MRAKDVNVSQARHCGNREKTERANQVEEVVKESFVNVSEREGTLFSTKKEQSRFLNF